MSSFANLKRSSEFEKIKKQLEETNTSPEQRENDRFWQPVVDKAGNGMAIVRFLPAPAVDGDYGLPWVRFWKHGFQAQGGWLIDDCLTTIGKPCPVCEYNTQLWNSRVDANKDIARKQKRKLKYVANVYIVSDPSNPENEGQVKLFEFGKKIFDKLNEAMNPEFPDEKPLNPFDFWKGADFKLKMRNVEGYRNYDKSEFSSPSALLEDDDAMEAIWLKEYSLAEFVDPTNFKSYEQIKKRLDVVLCTTAPKTKAEDNPHTPSKPNFMTQESVNKGLQSGSEEDKDMDYFRSLGAGGSKEDDEFPF